MVCPLAKKTKVRAFQPSWAEDYGFVFHKDRAVCKLCFEDAVSRYRKQANSLKVFATAKKHATEESFRNSEYECGW